MAIDRRAEAYAEQFHGIFVSRYIAAAKAGRTDLIPEPIRDMITCYVKGIHSANPVDPIKWVKESLYAYRVKYGRDCPLPPDLSSGSAAANGAAIGAAVGVGIAKTLFRLLR